ncbi:MAG: SDR family oxidoreductase [Proteobacteria bacterium]|nr:SDR family oxidoreductase [Pseudomonadota bacterium]
MIRSILIFGLMLICAGASAQTVLVTGSNRGIGLELVTQYAADGWDVIATSRSPADDDELQALAKMNANITIETLDVTDTIQIAALAEKYRGRPIDVLINNAGLLGGREGQDWGNLSADLFQQLMAVNVFGPMKVSEAFSANVALSKQKKIIVISSTIGSISRMQNPTPFPILATSKAAVNMAMRTVAMQLKDQGVTVAMLMPGVVRTRMSYQAGGMSLEEASEQTDFEFERAGTISAGESAARIIKVTASLDGSETGIFLNNDGSRVDW